MMSLPCKTQILINTGIISSGKSTLINAFAGQDLLATSNLSCTAQACLVTDIHNANTEKDDSHSLKHITEDALTPKEFTVVTTEMKRLSRNTMDIAIIDTPGVNDAVNADNRSIAYDTIKHLRDITIIYVSNLMNCGTTDDVTCLMNVAELIRCRKDRKWFAVLNGWDLAVPKRDRPEKYEEKIRTMAEQFGLPQPDFFYVSAMAAVLGRKALAKVELSDVERVNLERILRAYELGSKIPDWRYGDRPIGNKALRTVVYRSGIPKLEDALYRHLCSYNHK